MLDHSIAYRESVWGMGKDAKEVFEARKRRCRWGMDEIHIIMIVIVIIMFIIIITIIITTIIIIIIMICYMLSNIVL